MLRFINRMFTSHKDVNGIAGSAGVVVRFAAQAEDIANRIPTSQNGVEFFLAVPGCQAPFKLGGAGAYIRPGGASHLHANAES